MSYPTDKGGLRTPDVLEALLHAAPDAVLVSDEQGLIVIASEQVRKVFRAEPQDLLGQSVEMLLPAALRRVHQSHRTSYYAAPSTRPMGRGLRLVALRSDGTEFPAEISLSHIKTEDGLLVMAIVRDVTDRKTTETRLQEEHRRLEELIDLSPVGIFVVAGDGRVVLVNREAEQLMGFRSRAGDRIPRYESAFVYRRPDGSQYRPEELPLQRALHRGERVSAENVVFIAQDGKVTPTLIDAVPIVSDQGEIDGAMAIIQDITPLAEVERLREEIARLEERKRMEMDLHDEVIGSVYALTLQFEARLEDLKESSPELAEVFDSSIERLQRIISDIREHILDRPAGGARSSLRDALARLATDFHESTPIAVHLEAEHDVVLSDAELSAVVHVVWESLNNAVKHAQATRIVIRLSCVDDQVIVEVQDDGIGFEAQRPSTGNGHGLRNMSARALRAGATLAIDSAPGVGTTVVVRMPAK